MSVLRVATFNLLHGQSLRDGSVEPALLADAARRLGADLVGLQEVDRHQPRSGLVDQTEVVAAALGAAHWRFVPSLHGTPGHGDPWTASELDDGDGSEGPTYGIGLVSRFPVRSWAVRRFAAAPISLPLVVAGAPRPRIMRVRDEPRLALAAVVEGPAGPFTAVTAHLSFVPGYNARQLRAIASWASTMPEPVLLFGDFNLPAALPRWLTGWMSLAQAATYPSARPRVQFDHLLARGLAADRVRAEHVLALPVSDHCALAVDLEL
ncbi:MAG TPA: endonuclease/exonuclease/phosphatase family protein [Actinomycetes bacterium]